MGWGVGDLAEDRESVVEAGGEDAGGKDELDEEGVGAVEPGTKDLGVDLSELSDGGGGRECGEEGGVRARARRGAEVGIRRKC